jgi:hypothetical protein
MDEKMIKIHTLPRQAAPNHHSTTTKLQSWCDSIFSDFFWSVSPKVFLPIRIEQIEL